MEEKEKKSTGDAKEVVTLMIGDDAGETIQCQKQSLISKSDYFNAMFSSGMVESQHHTVKIKDIGIEMVKILIDFMTTGKIHLTVDIVYDVTAAACRFQITDLIHRCSKFLEKHLSHTNCFKTLECSNMYNLNKVQGKAKRYIQHYFSEICETAGFLSVDVKTLEWFLQQRGLNVKSEMDVYNALKRWIDSGMTTTSQLTLELFKQIHFEDIELEFEKLKDLKYFNQSEKQLVDKKMENEKQGIKKYRQVPEALLCAGIQYLEEDGRSHVFDAEIYRFDLKEFKLSEGVTDMSRVLPSVEDHGGYSVCLLGKDIIVSGGEPLIGKNAWNNAIYRFDTFENHWKKLTDLTSPRRHHASFTTKKCLYVLGGFGRYRVKLNSMEKFDIDEGKWSTAAPSPMHGFHKAIAVVNDYVYSLFSSDNAWCYNPHVDEWTKLTLPPSLLIQDAFLGAYLFKDEIYVIDAFHTVFVLKVVDVLSLKLIKTSNTFHHVNESVTGYQICNQKLYCMYDQTEPKMIYTNLTDLSTIVEKREIQIVKPQKNLTLLAESNLNLVAIPQYSLD